MLPLTVMLSHKLCMASLAGLNKVANGPDRLHSRAHTHEVPLTVRNGIMHRWAQAVVLGVWHTKLGIEWGPNLHPAMCASSEYKSCLSNSSIVPG